MNIEKLGLSERTNKALKKNGLGTTEELALCLPRAYHDYRKVFSIGDAETGRHCAVLCYLENCRKQSGKRSYIRLKVRSEGRQEPFFVFLFTEVYKYATYLSMIGRDIVICGKVTEDPVYGKGFGAVDAVTLREDFVAQIVPVYRKFPGIADATLRKLILNAAHMQPEVLEPDVREKYGLSGYRETLLRLHAPGGEDDIRRGRTGLCLNDLIYFSLLFFSHGTEKKGLRFDRDRETAEFIAGLPYRLTPDQKDILDGIIRNARTGVRNNMLLQGDVGSGKTIVAICAMVFARENGFQSVMMAPREVLAKQHCLEVSGYAEKIGARVVFLRSGMRTAERRKALDDIRTGKADFIIGTHSCIGADAEYKKLGLIITDEEHLFGVRQKEALEQKAKAGVHCVSMSATPIPRSLATVLYGNDKEVCTIRTMPEGRLPVKTCAVTGHNAVFPFIRKQAALGHRIYVVCPAIETGEESGLVNVEETEALYRQALEPAGIRIGTVHGKMKANDVEKTVAEFAKGTLDVLIATTVIEVGVNVPEATLIVVEQAERFGLASLHQLSGRVGRSDLQSYCVLITDRPSEPRIKTLCETSDGFKIAEADMQIRGTGNLIGTEQSGMNRYVTEMLRYPELFKKAREIAQYCMENRYGNYLIDMYRTVGQ